METNLILTPAELSLAQLSPSLFYTLECIELFWAFLIFYTSNYAIEVFLKVIFLGFVDAPVMGIMKYCHSHDQRASLESTLHNENAQDMILISSRYS